MPPVLWVLAFLRVYLVVVQLSFEVSAVLILDGLVYRLESVVCTRQSLDKF